MMLLLRQRPVPSESPYAVMAISETSGLYRVPFIILLCDSTKLYLCMKVKREGLEKIKQVFRGHTLTYTAFIGCSRVAP
jgi:hypothetical protein